MRPCGIQTAKMLSHENRSTAAWLLFGFVALIVCVAMSTSFVYETRSLLTKNGLDKSLDRAGQVIGRVAATLVCLQVVLAARISSLDRVLGLQNLLILHRLNGMLILNFGLTHAALIIFSTGGENLPFRWQHWPALVGGIMLIVLLVLVGTSIFRQRYAIRDKLWLRFHKPLGYLAFTGIIVHLLNVSESYLDGLLRLTVYVIAGCVLALVGSRKLARLWSIRRTGSITGLENVRSSAAVLYLWADADYAEGF